LNRRPSGTTCDLHLHSSASAVNDEWYSRTFGCPESYAQPHEQYALAKARGMTLVTLTDHDTIAGGLQLVDRPDFFLSEEVSTRFPEDDCAIHVLAWNITPAQHDRIQAVRGNVYALVELLRRESIQHACAHPLFSPNWKLSVAALEKILVLFPILERTNGLTDRRLEPDLLILIDGLDTVALAALARRHGLELAGSDLRKKRLVAGSDDHGLRHCASCFTEVAGAGADVHEFLAGVAAGEARCHGHQADLDVISLTASRITYVFLDARKLERPDYRDPFVDLIDVVAGRETGTGAPAGMREELVRSLIAGAARTATPLGHHLDPALLEDRGDAADARVMTGIRCVHDGLIGRAVDELVGGLGDLDLYRVFGGLRDLAAAVSTALPFLFAAHHFARQRGLALDVLAAWTASPRPAITARLAIFSDSLHQIDGVTSSLRRFVRHARASGRTVRIPYCGERPPQTVDTEVYVPLAGVASYSSNLYSAMEFHVPSLLGTIDWMWRQDITHVELATPGPMGLVGLLAARLLRLPVTASYHTDVPELLRQLSSSPVLHAGARSLVSWFYRTVDRVFVFSEASRQRLVEIGVPAERLEKIPVTIDPHEFSPDHRCSEVFRSFGICAGARVVLTVGRLSREKNLPLIIAAIDRLQASAHPPVLVIAGDGPERAALSASCANKPYVVFVGPQEGGVLQRMYANASVFVFAGQIDTLGLATMEAMASGVPVLVPATAAIAEHVIDGVSGYCYEFGVDGLAERLREVLDAPAQRAAVAANARRAMVDRWAQASFTDLWRAMASEAVHGA
jgi:glycosyltransferase involved in cell wall biosynthesis